jgi:uncharacterized protein YegL
MAYELLATTRSPALIIYLIDVSGSMSDRLDGSTKINHVSEALSNILQRMVQRSTKGEIVSARYRLAMYAYSDRPYDMLGGVESITEVVKRGRPKLTASNVTDTKAAFSKARDLLRNELPSMQGSPAPMVCHLTDGQFSGDDPEPVAREIMSMSTADGPVLIENIFVGPGLLHRPIADAENWRGVTSERDLKDPYAKKLFSMSSALPKAYASVVEREGYSLSAGSRMLIPCSNRDLLELAFAMSGATPTA